MYRFSILVVVPAAGLLVACGGGDAAQSGETVIETELEEQIGVGELDASCDQPEDDEVGTEFLCTASTEDGRIIEFLGAFTAEDEIFVSPTNLLRAEEVERLKFQAAQVLSPEVGVDIDPSQITCPEEDPLFMDTSGAAGEAVVECTITDEVSSTSFPLTVTLSDYVIREGYQNLFAQIGDPIG